MAKAAPARATVRPAEPPLEMAPAALEDVEELVDWVSVELEVEVEVEVESPVDWVFFSDLVLVASPVSVADAVLVSWPVVEASVWVGWAVPLAGTEPASGWPVTAPPALVWAR